MFYWISKCIKNVRLQYMYQEELVCVTYDTSGYTTIWFIITTLSLVLVVTITQWIYSLLFPSVQTICHTSVSTSGRMHTKFTVLLNLILVASLNELPS
jgi:hypothetical protein